MSALAAGRAGSAGRHVSGGGGGRVQQRQVHPGQRAARGGGGFLADGILPNSSEIGVLKHAEDSLSRVGRARYGTVLCCLQWCILVTAWWLSTGMVGQMHADDVHAKHARCQRCHHAAVCTPLHRFALLCCLDMHHTS